MTVRIAPSVLSADFRKLGEEIAMCDAGGADWIHVDVMDVLTIHAEAAPHLDRQISRIQSLGCKAGVALNPATPLSVIEEVAHMVDLVLIMSVNPGYGGQQFIEYSVDKIARARLLLDQANSNAALEVDGGMSRDTIQRCWAAGADTFVAGNAIFGAANPQAEIAVLRSLCVEHV